MAARDEDAKTIWVCYDEVRWMHVWVDNGSGWSFGQGTVIGEETVAVGMFTVFVTRCFVSAM